MASEERLIAARKAAREAFDADRIAAAAELLSAYLQHKPDDAFAWMLLGDSQRILGLVHEAEQSLLRSLDLNATRWITRARLGRLCADAGRHDEAEAWYAEALRNDDAATLGYLWIFRGSNLARHGLLKAAEECHRKATTLDSKDTDIDEAYLNLGYVLRAQGRYAEAEAAFRRALEICPDYPEAEEALRSLDGIDAAIAKARELRNA